MQTRKLGYTDLDLTTVGLGTWAIGGPWQYGWSYQDDHDSLKTISEALDTGINWIDTAPIYGCGHSEEVIGTVLHKIGVKPLVATKCGLLWDDERRKVNCLRRPSIKKECEDSLRRLHVEVIDLYQMHWPVPDEQIEEAWGAMAELVKEGKVRYIGVSNFSVPQMKRLSAIHPIASTQPCYNMLCRDIEGEYMNYCAENQIGIVAYSPMQMGLLTGKFDLERAAKLPADDVRRKKEIFAEPSLSVTIEIVDQMKNIAQAEGKSMSQLAIAWVLSKPEVTAAIVGSRKPGQILETAPASDWQLTESLVEEIEKLLVYRQQKLS